MIEVVTAQGAELVTVVRALFREYADAIGVDLEYQQFAAELAGLPSLLRRPNLGARDAGIGIESGSTSLARGQQNRAAPRS
jgi:hypothetical protein